jgi:flagellar assembly protein FliH
MIVRDAVLAEELYTVGSAPAAGSVRERARPVPLFQPPSLGVPATHELVGCEAEVQPAALVLTLEIVAAWLAAQDHEVLRELPSVALELAEIREDAHTMGFNAGRVAGTAAAAETTARLHEQLEGIIEAVRAECLRAQDQLAQQCVEIVAAAIGQIAGPLLATREAAVGAVAAALAKVKAAAELTVRVNPADLPSLEEQRAKLAAVTAASHLHLLADAQVALGGCLIDSSAGTLDARLELQLEGLCESLRAARARMAAP